MDFNKIVGFGDSWIFGDELLDPKLAKQHTDAHPCWYQNTAYRESHCFLGLLGQHYSVPTVNYGIPGGSLTSTMWRFIQWLESEPNPEQALVLVGLTEADRFTLWNPSGDNPDRKMVHSTWAEMSASEVPRQFLTMMKMQIALTVSDELRSLNYQQAALLFDGTAARRNLNLIQFNIADAPAQLDLPTLIQPNRSFITWFVHELQPKHGRYYVKEDGHPNELGHVLIRDFLINHIG